MSILPYDRERPGDKMCIRGWLRMEAYTKQGELFQVEESHNVIVRAGATQMLNLLANRGGSLGVGKMAVGEGGCGLNPTIQQLYAPVPFNPEDGGLRHELRLVRQIEPNPQVDSGSATATFTAFFNSADVPSDAYISGIPNVCNECALLSGDDVVMALRSFKSIPFDQASAIGLRAVWILQVGL